MYMKSNINISEDVFERNQTNMKSESEKLKNILGKRKQRENLPLACPTRFVLKTSGVWHFS